MRSKALRMKRMNWTTSMLAVAGVALCGAVAGGAEPRKIEFLTIEGKPRETPGPLAWLMHGAKERTLGDYTKAIQAFAADDANPGMVIRLKDAALSTAQIDELGAAIGKARGAGKKVHVFAESYGPTELLLAAHADEVIAQKGAPVELPGLYMEEMFLADTLSWAGIKADMVQVGDYKGASEQFGRSAPSPQWDENINQLLDSMYGNMRATIKRGRKLDDAGLDRAMEKAWMCFADEAKTVGLVDAEADLPALQRHLEKAYGGPVAYEMTSFGGASTDAAAMMANPFAMMQMLAKKPDHSPKRPTIAVLSLGGTIIDGDSTGGGLFGGDSSVGSRTIRNAIEELLKEDLIKGVVVRIDSPGGSAVASEVMWQGLRRLAEKKPVWASVGSMAASGGYYVAVGTDRIYANPSSIVGSIGVVGGRLSMDGLYEKLKVGVVSRTRGPKAGMFRSTTPWNDQELALVRTKMAETYSLFTKRVTQGRKGIDLGKTAEGRLFTGDKALKLGMVDEIGGLDDTVTGLAKSLDLSGYDIMTYPGPKGIDELIEETFGGLAAANGGGDPVARSTVVPPQLAATIRATVGEHAWPQVRGALIGLMELRERPVILMSPRVIVVK